MAVDPKRALLLVTARIALADGAITDGERALLLDLAGDDAEVERALKEARSASLDELARSLDRYADRFFVALRARACALEDGLLDPVEARMFSRLVEALRIDPEDVDRIERLADPRSDGRPDRRVRRLFAESSFAGSGSEPC